MKRILGFIIPLSLCFSLMTGFRPALHDPADLKNDPASTTGSLYGYQDGCVHNVTFPAGKAAYTCCMYSAAMGYPAGTVISAEQGKRLGKNCVMLELASEPGGFAAQLPVLMGRGLPGTCVPVTGAREFRHLAGAYNALKKAQAPEADTPEKPEKEEE